MTMSIEAPIFTLGERLRKARQARRLDQGQLAAELGIARNTLSGYENERNSPPFDVTVKWARLCGVSLDWLAEGVETETTPAENDEGQWRAPRDSNPRPSDP